MTGDSPYHAHIYFAPEQKAEADLLHKGLKDRPDVLFVGQMTEGKTGPHPIPQFEVHFLEKSLDSVVPLIEASGLRALVHPLTNDDMADHTTLSQWIGEPVELDLSTLDPPGLNQGVARFGKSDF